MLVCNNGLGHISRSVYVANFLSKNFDINIFSSKQKVRKFKLNKKIKIKNLSIGDPKNDKRNYSKLKKFNFRKYDVNYSDSLLDKEIINQNFLLYSNFFWHQILNLKGRKYRLIENKLKKNNTPILGNYIFQNIKCKLNFIKIGFLGKFQGKFKYNNNILISLGTANIEGYKKKILIEGIKNILENPKLKQYNFYIDKHYIRYLDQRKFRYKIFNYKAKMFKKISLAIVKPGFGILNDLFRHGIPIVNISFRFNKEFTFNTNQLKKRKLILFETNLKNFSTNLKNKISKRILFKFYKRYKSLKWDGEREILKLLQKTF